MVAPAVAAARRPAPGRRRTEPAGAARRRAASGAPRGASPPRPAVRPPGAPRRAPSSRARHFGSRSPSSGGAPPARPAGRPRPRARRRTLFAEFAAARVQPRRRRTRLGAYFSASTTTGRQRRPVSYDLVAALAIASIVFGVFVAPLGLLVRHRGRSRARRRRRHSRLPHAIVDRHRGPLVIALDAIRRTASRVRDYVPRPASPRHCARPSGPGQYVHGRRATDRSTLPLAVRRPGRRLALARARSVPVLADVLRVSAGRGRLGVLEEGHGLRLGARPRTRPCATSTSSSATLRVVAALVEPGLGAGGPELVDLRGVCHESTPCPRSTASPSTSRRRRSPAGAP